jgi:hypothetical protein
MRKDYHGPHGPALQERGPVQAPRDQAATHGNGVMTA